MLFDHFYPVISAVLTTICISIIIRMSRNTSPAYAKLLLIVTVQLSLPETWTSSFTSVNSYYNWHHFYISLWPCSTDSFTMYSSMESNHFYSWKRHHLLCEKCFNSVSKEFQATWVTVICWNAVAYGACFIHRHQVAHCSTFQIMDWSQAVVPPGYPDSRLKIVTFFCLQWRSFSPFADRYYWWFLSIATMHPFFTDPTISWRIFNVEKCMAGFVCKYKNRREKMQTTVGFTDSQLKRLDCYEIHLLFIFIGYCYSMFAICFCFLVTVR